MAATNVTLPTLADLAKRTDASWKNALPLIMLLAKRHGLYAAMRFEEANMGLSHRTSVVTSLPTSSYRMFNLGLDASDGSYANAVFPVAKIGTLAEIDWELVKVAPNREAFVAGKVMTHVESLLQKASNEMWYGTAATAEGIVGFASLMSSLSAENAQNIINGKGSDSGDQTSIYLLNIGPNCKAIYPTGTPAGIERDIVGESVSESLGGTGKRGKVWREFINVGVGVALEDWRDAARVANIDVSNMLAETNDADLIKLTRKAKHRMLSRPEYDRRWFMHPTTWEYIQHQRDDRQVAGGGVSKMTIDGVEVPTLHDIPVVIDDNILLTESVVS